MGWVRSISVHESGQFLASGGDDGTMRVWEVTTGRCLRRIEFGEKVRRVGEFDTWAILLRVNGMHRNAF